MSTSITCAGCKHSYDESALFCPNCGRPKVREATSDALVGKLLGERFQVQELIGQGGSGTIYRAEHVTLRRRVAIKVLHDELSRDDLAVERFRREATTVAEIDNEHIVEIHDFGRTPDGRLYLAMELLEGETLDSVLARETQLSVERAADILIQVGEALMEAHAIGYVHRDLRPRNIYLAVRRGKANFVKLLDFGLAKLVETDASAASTSLGMTFGDPRYMSPEQARGDRIDRRADIYQLGCVAYEMLTGAPPFSGHRVFDILTKQVTEVPVPLPSRRPGVPLWMEAAVAKMLAKDPENRFATTTRMVEALRRGLETGEVMEDEVARRRESIPPPSVSRVMQKMGIATPIDPAPPASETNKSLPPAPKHTETTRGISAVSAKPDSIELLRKRTGTPQLGVSTVAAAVAQSAMMESQAPVAGTIERRAKSPSEAPRPRSPSDAPRPRSPSGPVEGRVRRPTDQPGISGVWFDEGDRASDEPESSRRDRARKLISPSTTDMSMYDELPRGRRWGLILGALGAFAVIGGIAFALSRGNDETTKPQPAAQPVAATTQIVDAAPSQVIADIDAAVAEPTPEPAAKPAEGSAKVADKTPDKTAKPADKNVKAVRPPVTSGNGATNRKPGGDLGTFVPPGSEGITRRPGGDTPPVVITNPKPDKDPNGGGLNSGPQDPYGNDPSPGSGTDGAPAEKKAEFYANLGSQQLASGDTTTAASSFKKALEIDGSNAIATIGMGEIALRQGLFGDAIAHLRKGTRLAPKSARAFTLLGEAYLSSGNHKEAASNFKRALQIDPDNTRARDGYNEASSRVPPPSDD
ncbi:MAG TPA: protein kinase [Kofleriaceae bacterium]|nr:protein kinase [Kofleriaceae bacterium]